MGKATPRRRANGGKPRPHRPSGADADTAAVEHEVTDVLMSNTAAALAVPPCVRQLREAQEYAVLEEACGDVAYFARQAKQNASLLAEGVPQRIAELLLAPPFDHPQHSHQQQASAGTDCENGSSAAMVPHKGILYMQIAAAEALRSLVANSEQDHVIDALVSTAAVGATGAGFASGLAHLAQVDWTRVQEARRSMTPADWMEVYRAETEDGEDGGDGVPGADGGDRGAAVSRRSAAGGSRNVYFSLLRHLEETLALATVCAEASEVCAEALADPAVLVLLLEVLRVSSTTTWETLLHPTAHYYRAENDDGKGSGAAGAAASETVLAMRLYKRREACLLAALAVNTADLLLLLSPDCPSLARVFTGAVTGSAAAAAAASASSSSSSPSASSIIATMTAEQQVFLNTAVDAVDLRAWLTEKPAIEAQLQERMSDAVPPTFLGASPLTVVGLERERVLYDLLRATLAIQGMLLNIAPVAANIQRVLPLLTDTLHKASLPMHVWCGVLPLLMDTCEYLNGRADDADVRTAATALTTHRLRATQAAVRLLHVLVNVVCETNDSDKHGDDEAAFAANPLGALLHSGSLFYGFGLLLKDVLWMSPTSGDASASNGNGNGNGGGGDVVTRQAQQRALRAESVANATATEVQMVVLATEVHVWEVASTLLLMLPVVSLGDPSLTWRALVQAVQSRYELHLQAAAAAAPDTSASNIVQHSARTHQLLWMQLESLGQMLWTMQRKQSKASGGGALAAAPFNHVLATSADVDLLVRVAWESAASVVLRQSCVGTVGLLCTSMQSPDAVATAARFALAVVANGGPAAASAVGKKLLEVYAQVLPSATVPTGPAERRVWMQQLSVVDATATVRSEAANTLVDLFLDERFDAAVYWPLRVQEGLAAFKAQLAPFVKRRRQLDKETKKHYHVSTETPEAEQWAEVLENLDGFLDYKASHK